jgi:hypothetical protein
MVLSWHQPAWQAGKQTMYRKISIFDHYSMISTFHVGGIKPVPLKAT